MASAAARRLSHSIASSIVLREVSVSHKLTIDGFRPSKNLYSKDGWFWYSSTFDVAGFNWRVRYYPQRDNRRAISLHLELDPKSSKDDQTGAVQFAFSLLDQSGNPVPEFTCATTEPCAFSGTSRSHGFNNFITWKDLEASGCLKDDSFAVRCDVTVTKNNREDSSAAAAAPAAHVVVVPPSDLHEHLADVLWKKEGTDVTVDVGGETTAFDAHGWLLAQRSPFFKAELELLAAATKEKKTAAAGAHRHRVEIKGMEPKVFEAVLHYMYTDALPVGVEQDDVPAVLAAAVRFKIERLKLMCEEMLSKRIDVSTAPGTLAVAEQHGCKALKAACLEFLMARPENLNAVMESEGYEKAKATIHPFVMELFMKQWLASQSATKCPN